MYRSEAMSYKIKKVRYIETLEGCLDRLMEMYFIEPYARLNLACIGTLV